MSMSRIHGSLIDGNEGKDSHKDSEYYTGGRFSGQCHLSRFGVAAALSGMILMHCCEKAKSTGTHLEGIMLGYNTPGLDTFSRADTHAVNH